MRAHLLVFAAAAMFVAACGGENGAAPAESGVDAANHIHGLGIDPADGALFIATHSGLFRAPQGVSEPTRVGDQFQDTMGFTVIGPNRFLGSGHPGPGQSGPPNLGLIESSNAGRSWSEVSLAAQADLHVLKYAHRRIYAYNALTNELLLSDDGGKTWEGQTPPATLIDLAVNPRDPEQLLVSTEVGLQTSSDGGETWRPTAGEIGLLAWPAPKQLYLIDAVGKTHTSTGPEESWRLLGDLGGQPVALSAAGPSELYAALADGSVLRSLDGGTHWQKRASL